VHLVWAPLGTSALEGFLGAHASFPPGIEHRLVVILNGFEGSADARLAEVERLLAGVEHERVLTPSPVADLTAYHQAAQETDARRLCFLNSYSRPLLEGWLSLLAGALSEPSVGLVGASGSYESAYDSAPFWLRRRRRGEFPPFPNPHLRTNGFMLDRELMLELDWSVSRAKREALARESGTHSVSRQVWERGLDVRVVGRDGVAYGHERWQESATFRSGDQRNLLIADNRTRQYEQASPGRRRQLSEMAWGRQHAIATA
jgi:hypothetical protein